MPLDTFFSISPPSISIFSLVVLSHADANRVDAKFSINPSIGDPKWHELLHAQGSHVDPYVIIYVLKGDVIAFLYVGHHDFVYGKTTEIMKKWEDEILDQIPNCAMHVK
jgi:hypothetical protein